MKARILGGVCVLLMSLNGTALAEAPLSLREVLEVARGKSAAVALADLELAEAQLAFEEGKANLVLHPSVTQQLQSENTWKAAQARRDLARRDLDLKVQQAYYDVLRTEMAENLARRVLGQAQAQLASTRSRHAQGMLSDVDLLAAESQLASGEADLGRAQANQRNARMQLNRLMGRDLEQTFEVKDEFATAPVEVDLDQALSSANRGRLEIQRARATLALREKELAVSDPSFTPAMTVRKAQLAAERARAELSEVETGILLEVRQNFQSVKEAEARIPIMQKNLSRAKESLRITEARYNVGVITSVDLIEAQKTAFQAETQVIQAIFDYNTALARFFMSAGDQPGEGS